MRIGVKIRVKAALGRAKRADVRSNMRTRNIVDVVRKLPMSGSSHDIVKSIARMVSSVSAKPRTAP